MSHGGAGQRTGGAAASLRLTAGGGASGCGTGPARRARRVVLVVGDPDVAVAIDEDAVRADEESRAETFDQPAVGGVVENRIERRHLAGCGVGDAAVHAAALRHPDALAVLADLDGARGSP